MPQIPRKWKWRGAALLTRILYAASGDLATGIRLKGPPTPGKMHGTDPVKEREEKCDGIAQPIGASESRKQDENREDDQEVARRRDRKIVKKDHYPADAEVQGITWP